MKQLTMTRTAEAQDRHTDRKIIPLRVLIEASKTRPIDVIQSSAIRNGEVYIQEGNGVRRLRQDEQPSSCRYLLRTNELTNDQRKDLQEQNVRLHTINNETHVEVSALAARALMDLVSGVSGCQ
jgi:hypothetical protein